MIQAQLSWCRKWKFSIKQLDVELAQRSLYMQNSVCCIKQSLNTVVVAFRLHPQPSVWYCNYRAVCVLCVYLGFIHEKSSHLWKLWSTCCLFVLGQTLCLVFTFGWKWGQCLRPWWEPTCICCACLSARHTSFALFHTQKHTNTDILAGPQILASWPWLGGNVEHFTCPKSLQLTCCELKVAFVSCFPSLLFSLCWQFCVDAHVGSMGN